MQVLEYIFLGNSIKEWLLALLVFFLTLLVFGVIRAYLLRRIPRMAGREGSELNELVQDLIKRTNPYLVFFLALYLGSLTLSLTDTVTAILRKVAIVTLILQAALLGMGLIDYLVRRRIKADPKNEAATATTMGAVALILKIALWSIVTLLILENVTGMEMDALIAALGVSGIAVALAVQNILGDLFSSVSIALDKPFVIGDSITVGEFSGTVEHIGLKSTRLRSLSGEQLIFSNSDLLSSRIQNFRRLEQRRVAFVLGVSTQTPYEKLEVIPNLIQEIIESQDETIFDRVVFMEFGAYTHNFEVVYFIDSPEVKVHIDTRHRIYMSIQRRFEEEGIDMPFPTQTILLERQSGS